MRNATSKFVSKFGQQSDQPLNRRNDKPARTQYHWFVFEENEDNNLSEPSDKSRPSSNLKVTDNHAKTKSKSKEKYYVNGKNAAGEGELTPVQTMNYGAQQEFPSSGPVIPPSLEELNSYLPPRDENGNGFGYAPKPGSGWPSSSQDAPVGFDVSKLFHMLGPIMFPLSCLLILIPLLLPAIPLGLLTSSVLFHRKGIAPPAITSTPRPTTMRTTTKPCPHSTTTRKPRAPTDPPTTPTPDATTTEAPPTEPSMTPISEITSPPTETTMPTPESTPSTPEEQESSTPDPATPTTNSPTPTATSPEDEPDMDTDNTDDFFTEDFFTDFADDTENYRVVANSVSETPIIPEKVSAKRPIVKESAPSDNSKTPLQKDNAFFFPIINNMPKFPLLFLNNTFDHLRESWRNIARKQ